MTSTGQSVQELSSKKIDSWRIKTGWAFILKKVYVGGDLFRTRTRRRPRPRKGGTMSMRVIAQRGAAFDRTQGTGLVSLGTYVATNLFKQAAPAN